jgi:predicted nuclease with TOPRIM domain
MPVTNNEELLKRIARLVKQNQELEEHIKNLEKMNEKLIRDNDKIKALYEKISPEGLNEAPGLLGESILQLLWMSLMRFFLNLNPL